MSHALSFFTLLLVFSRSDAQYYGQLLLHCQFSSLDGHDAVYQEELYFNKMLIGQYSSTLGKVIGYTKKAKEFADSLNKNPVFLKHEKWKTEYCKRNGPLLISKILALPVEPSVWLRSVEAASSRHPSMLICSVYNFYPKQIQVTWLKNGKKVTSDVTSTEELPNGDWLYQIHSHLEFTPKPGEKITCMVEHASLKEPKLYDWNPMPDSGMNKIAVGIAGLLLGLILPVAALIYYKKKSCVHITVPTTEVLYPEHTL